MKRFFCFCALLFLIIQPIRFVRAVSGQVVINEIAWAGTAASANDEWMELYNDSDEDIDLAGWALAATDGQPQITLTGRISAHGYFLLERTDDTTVNDIVADQIYSGSLENAGEKLVLKNASGEIIDSAEYESGWPAGDSTTKASMERGDLTSNSWHTNDGMTINGKDANNAALLATPRSANSAGAITGTMTPTATSSNASIDTASSSPHKMGDVVINEFLVDPGDGETEWIELFSSSEKEISLVGWSVEDGANSRTSINGVIGGTGEKFFVIGSPKGSLNNAGDYLALRDSSGALIDRVVYGDWDDGNKSDNAPTVADSATVARKVDGENSYNNHEDFVITYLPTKGLPNIIENEDGGARQYTGLWINEILPNPYGLDNDNEFIELINQGHEDIDISSWRLGDTAGRKYRLVASSSYDLAPGEYAVIYRSATHLALDNSGGSVKLFAPDSDKPIQSVKYGEAGEDKSYIWWRGGWEWSGTSTPGRENILERDNTAPTAGFECIKKAALGEKVRFDSSDSDDFDGDTLSYFWDFGDGSTNILTNPEHVFFEAGKFSIHLFVSDGIATSTTIHEIEIGDAVIVKKTQEQGKASTTNLRIVINEAMPDPGKNKKEWVELKNLSTVRANLSGWKIDDGEGGSHPYVFSENFWIEPSGFALIGQEQSKISLNNDADAIRLFDAGGGMISTVGYVKAKSEQSYARSADGGYVWTGKATPGTENIILNDSSKTSVATGKTGVAVAGKISDGQMASLGETADLPIGAQVVVRGAVSVLPGIFGSQVFYVYGPPSLEIYNYKKDFPDLKIGDSVEIKGEISEASGVKRLKTKTKADILVLSSGSLPSAEQCSCQEIGEQSSGELVRLQGEITDKKGSILYVDDGSGEATIYLKKSTGLTASLFDEGQTVAVTGMITDSQSGRRIQPRGSEDIVVLGEDSSQQSLPQVLGERSSSSDWQLDEKGAGDKYKYLIISISGLILAIILVYKKQIIDIFKKM